MNISKINSTSFRGKLTIFTKKMGEIGNSITFDTDNIEYIKDEQNWRRTEISGRTLAGKYTSVTIPYSVVSPEKIIASYTAACQNKNINISINNKENSNSLII